MKYINQSECKVASIDIPSGLMAENNSFNARTNIIQADYTFTLQQKKLAFLFAENQVFIGKLRVLDIRLSAEGLKNIDADFTMRKPTSGRCCGRGMTSGIKERLEAHCS